ncbi:MAG: hypothetical protein PHG27_00845 [Massilibacteroides sp.]|nr:hypothetical protein [Massilibacteroides sp.]MDD3063381.1 hypothetical protein [Massilibacteroides sp.]MDD4114134.1 hypothetical protein [Massilibacteroides sp.]MDD4659101.1 hypothetical protein [Massilibacteroides sp.]
MKALIVSFFCILWGYSLFFDKKETKENIPVRVSEIPVSNPETVRGNIYMVDTMGYYAKKNDAFVRFEDTF